MKVEIDLPELATGFEYTGEYRVPRDGEWYLTADLGTAAQCREDQYLTYRHILRKVPVWRDATVEDAVRAIRGEKVAAHVRDSTYDEWMTRPLIGYVAGSDFPWVCGRSYSADDRFAYCQVQE